MAIQTSTTDSPDAARTEPERFQYVVSEGMADLIASFNCTLAATTYQAGKLVLFRADGGRLSALLRTFDSAMGLAVAPDRLAIGTRHAIWLLRDAPEIGRQLEPKGKHDHCFVPRSAHITGDIRIHDLAYCGDELWFVNTRFSCLCTLDSDNSFVPRWRPPFVPRLEPDDCCHLNGLGVCDGRPGFVTALGETDTAEGWRANKATGGVILDVASGEVICRGLAMPHSPRWHRGQLFVLNSGCGDLNVVDLKTGKRETVARLPGYTRGLALCGEYAFLGLSKIREKREFGGLPVETLGAQICCGIWIVNLVTGRIEGSIEFIGGIEEIFAVEVLSGMRYPAAIGFEKDAINGIYIMPPGADSLRGSIDAVMATLADSDDGPVPKQGCRREGAEQSGEGI